MQFTCQCKLQTFRVGWSKTLNSGAQSCMLICTIYTFSASMDVIQQYNNQHFVYSDNLLDSAVTQVPSTKCDFSNTAINTMYIPRQFTWPTHGIDTTYLRLVQRVLSSFSRTCPCQMAKHTTCEAWPWSGLSLRRKRHWWLWSWQG